MSHEFDRTAPSRWRRAALCSALPVLLTLAACGGSSSSPGGGGSGSSGASSSGSGSSGSSSGGSVAARCQGSIAPGLPVQIANAGHTVFPLGRMTRVGNLPTGGALSPDGRFYWAVDSGFGLNDVQIVDVASGVKLQTLPLPGAYGSMVFSPDGSHAYVSGEPVGSGNAVAPGGLKGTAGDVIHVFSIDLLTGLATEQTPISLPSTQGGSGRVNSLPPSPGAPSWPVGLAITADGKTLVVALNNADKAAIVDLATGSASTVSTGHYPYGAAIERKGHYAFVGNELDGTLTQIDLSNTSASPTTISGLGGGAMTVPGTGDYGSHPQAILADPNNDRLFVAVTNRDAVAVIDTVSGSVSQTIALGRSAGTGVAPVALALSPNGDTLYVADAGENAVAAVALTDRSGGAKAFQVIGRIPTLDYTHDVQVSHDGCTMVWTAARGLSAGPNFGYQFWTFGPPSPYPTYLPQLLTGQVGVLPTPADAAFAALDPVVSASLIPGDGSGATVAAPAGTPLVGSSGGPSQQIKYVFYLVRENRTYDQIFGSHANANGDPALELFDDNGAHSAGAAGITPNAHTLADRYVLLDNFYEDSEVSVDGHIITGSGYATDYVNKAIHANYANRGRPYDFGIWPVTFPPQGFLFDQAVRQGVSFRNYGEGAAGVLVSSPDRTASGNNVYAQVVANTLAAYPTDAQIGCETTAVGVPNSPQCVFDAGMGTAPPLALSRIDIFNADFAPRARAGTVPALNYLVMTNDHTHGYKVGDRDPLAMVADNDLGLGQLVQIISSYPAIWAQSVIFVVEDDSQDGQDHVDAHRAPALVIGPWVKRGAIVHTHYDQYSVLRTIELILGLKPLSLHDANALPMYDLFIDAATASPAADTYTAVPPTQNIQAVLSSSSSGGSSSGSSSGAAAASSLAAFSAALPWQQRDAVPQELSDRILWQRVHGADSTPPPPGPNASPLEHQRAVRMMEAYRRGDLAQLRELAKQVQDDDD